MQLAYGFSILIKCYLANSRPATTDAWSSLVIVFKLWLQSSCPNVSVSSIAMDYIDFWRFDANTKQLLQPLPFGW